MSGLYNMLFGYNPAAKIVLTMLEFENPGEVGRFRDAYFQKNAVDGEICGVVLTRMGGGNRPDYPAEIGALREHPDYRFDQDCSGDSTYAEFWFRIPEEVRDGMPEVVEKWPQSLVTETLGERFSRKLDEIKKGK